jgi:hypothetical protein
MIYILLTLKSPWLKDAVGVAVSLILFCDQDELVTISNKCLVSSMCWGGRAQEREVIPLRSLKSRWEKTHVGMPQNGVMLVSISTRKVLDGAMALPADVYRVGPQSNPEDLKQLDLCRLNKSRDIHKESLLHSVYADKCYKAIMSLNLQAAQWGS